MFINCKNFETILMHFNKVCLVSEVFARRIILNENLIRANYTSKNYHTCDSSFLKIQIFSQFESIFMFSEELQSFKRH